MEKLHAQIAAVGLAAVGSFGFALAGGYAVQVHGLLRRRSDDVDLFTDRPDPAAFARAVRTAISAYEDAGFHVDVEVSADVFARLHLSDPNGEQAKVEFACDWRAHQPVQLDIGPVLHPDDAVANKVAALFGRAAPRDYVDVHAALVSDRTPRIGFSSLPKSTTTASTRPGRTAAGCSSTLVFLWAGVVRPSGSWRLLEIRSGLLRGGVRVGGVR